MGLTLAPAVFRSRTRREDPMKLFLAGDVMTGRGVDQVLPHPVDPGLHEPYVSSARRYVALAEERSGPISAPVSWDYVWGDALDELDEAAPHVRIINLETSVTTSDDWLRSKGIHYRMHPDNAPVLSAAGIDICVLANNHVLDWGRVGLLDTLEVLEDRGIAVAGAGRDRSGAARPAAASTDAGRLLVFAWAMPDAGVPASWAAAEREAGVNVLPALDPAGLRSVVGPVAEARRSGDRVVVSIHWGGNWGYRVPPAQREFAHRLVDSGAVDVVFGHSSHHPRGIEVYRDRLILYGAGDFLNDYEGIGGRESFRPELTLMYFPELGPSGALRRLRMAPMRIHRLRLSRAAPEDARWLADTLDRESRKLTTRVRLAADGRLEVRTDR